MSNGRKCHTGQFEPDNKSIAKFRLQSQPASQPAGQTELSKKGVKANVDM